MSASSQHMDSLTQIEGQTLDEPPPPPIPPRRKTWNCVECSRVETPVKRSGPKGPGTLCNACGIAFRKKLKLAAANPAATSKPPQKKLIEKNKLRPRKKPIKRKCDHEPPPKKTYRRQTSQFQNVQSTAVPPPGSTVSQPLSSPVTTVTSQLVRTPSPSSLTVPTSAVAPVTCVPQPAMPPSATHIIPSPLPSASFATPSILPPSPIGDSRPTSGVLSATATQRSAPVPSPPHIHGPVPDTPITSEPQPLLQSETPLEPMMTLLRQSSQTEESNTEGILSPLDMSPVAMNIGATQFASRTHETTFPDGMLVPPDSTATTSTPGEVLSVLDDMTGYSDTWPPGTGMVSVEGPYGQEGCMAAPTGLIDMPEIPMAAPVGLTMAAVPPVPEMTHPPSSVPPNVLQHDAVARCINTLTALDLKNTRICQSMSSFDKEIAVFSRRHEELTLERNELTFSITQLINMKEAARKKHRLVCEYIARTKSFLQYLRKQERQVGNT